MLVLTRKVDESITIGDDITVMVVSITVDRVTGAMQVRLGIDAPKDIPVHRDDINKRTRGGQS